MENRSKVIASVATVAGVVLALSGCSFSVYRTYDPALGKQYLSAVCPVYADQTQLAAAEKAQDLPAFTAAAGKAHDDLGRQITALQSPAIPWPSPIDSQVHVLVDADSKLITMFGDLSAATTGAQIQAVRTPDTTAAQKAANEIRAELNLPARTAGGGC